VATFEDVWRRVLLHVPSASPFLAQDWVQQAYSEFCTRRNWSHLRAETTLRTKVAKTGTCTVTQDSLTVAGGTLLFAASDVGRQFRLSATIPIYTITAVSLAGGTSATLDRTYAGASAAATAGIILDAYVTMPASFKEVAIVTDVSRWWILHLYVSELTLGRWDPLRSAGGPPRVLANLDFSPVTGVTDRVRYELWPYSLAEAYWPMRYFVMPAALTDTSPFVGAFAQRTDVLVNAALAKCALWPGPSADRKNPYFNPALAQTLDAKVEAALNVMQVQDEDVFATWLQPQGFQPAPLDAAWLQQTDFAVQYSG
jgi:hypothetical protein